MKRAKSGFTLIELLIVIAIIGILISLLFPVISSVRHSARKSAAKVDMQSIGNAVEEYYAIYRKLPIHDESFSGEENKWYEDEDELKEIFSILQGANENGMNPREETFLETQEGRPFGVFLDPWSTGTDLDDEENRQYRLLFDHDLDGKIKLPEVNRDFEGRMVIVKSIGSNRESDYVSKEEWWGGKTWDKSDDFDDLYSVDLSN